MTRGKQIQDFIKENKKTARERFEEAGWVFVESFWNIRYRKENSFITFDKYNKSFHAEESYDPMEINMETLKLIIAQCKELGWL